jgi:hypothetical protein
LLLIVVLIVADMVVNRCSVTNFFVKVCNLTRFWLVLVGSEHQMNAVFARLSGRICHLWLWFENFLHLYQYSLLYYI